MTSIKITDLSLLETLSEEQLKELFGAGPRRFKPSFEFDDLIKCLAVRAGE